MERLGRGESFGITYRNRTVGELFPPTVSYEISPDDPVYRITEMAGDLGEVWTPGRSTELFTAALLVARRAGGLLGEFFDLLGRSAALTLTPVGMGRFREACGYLLKHRDQGYSFTDVTSFIVMRELGMSDALTEDQRFEKAGFRCLLKIAL